MTNWATATDVDTYTGITATDAEVLRAQALIELFSGTTTDASDDGLISTRNLRHLKMAVAYQAAWMTMHPDVFTNVDLNNISQDGVSATMQHDNAALLAPLALRCLRRLSWWNAPHRAHKRFPASVNTGNRDSAVGDDNIPWAPLP